MQAGEWFDVTVNFLVRHVTEALRLDAPVGFELATVNGTACFLPGHTLPGLSACEVSVRDDGGQPLDPSAGSALGKLC